MLELAFCSEPLSIPRKIIAECQSVVSGDHFPFPERIQPDDRDSLECFLPKQNMDIGGELPATAIDSFD